MADILDKLLRLRQLHQLNRRRRLARRFVYATARGLAGYRLALGGFDFADERERRRVLGSFKAYLNARGYVDVDVSSITHAWELAEVGEEFFAQFGLWCGRLDLMPGSVGLKLFERFSTLDARRTVSFAKPCEVMPTLAQARGVSKRSFLGKCFDKSGQYVMSHANEDGILLVHGTIQRYGEPLGHAWVELSGGKVFDGALQKFFDKTSYYAAFNAKAERKYSPEQVFEQTFETLNWGPWHHTAGLVRRYGERNEEDHPRDDEGKFVEKNGGGATAPKRSSDYPKANRAPSMLEQQGGIDTLTQYTLPNGQLTPERKQLHDAIVNEQLSAGKPAVGKHEVYLMGGGSGKSIIQRQLKLPDMMTVDVDVVRTKLPEWTEELEAAKAQGRKPNVLLASYTHEEASLIGKRIIDEAVKRNYNLMIDGVGDSSIDKLEANVRRYRANGGKIVANYVTLDYDEAYRRMRARGDKTGRYTPAAYLREAHAQVSRVVPEAIRRGLFDEFTLWDNNSKPFKVASVKNKTLTIHNQKAWQSFLDKGKGIQPREGEI